MSGLPRAPASLVPPSVADLRGRAFGAAMERAFAEADFRPLLVERIGDVDARLLPWLVRELSMEEFVEPDMREDVVRDLLAGAYEIHARKGYIDGVRWALSLIGLSVWWRQWFQMRPQGAPGTHEATIFVGRRVYLGDGPLIDARAQRLALRFVSQTKRWSQDVSLRLGLAMATSIGVAARAQGVGLLSARVESRPNRLGRQDIASGLGLASRARATSVAFACASARPSRPPVAAVAALASRATALSSLRLAAEAAARARPAAGIGALARARSMVIASIRMEIAA